MKLGERLMELMNAFLRVGSVMLVVILEIVVIVGSAIILQRNAVYLYLLLVSSLTAIFLVRQKR